MTALTFCICTLVTGQANPDLPNKAWYWFQAKPNPAVSAKWAKIEADCAKWLAALKADGAASRNEKMERALRLVDERDPASVYWVGLIGFTFKNELKTTWNLYIGTMTNARGSSDPVFVRLGYKAMCLFDFSRPHRDSLGRELLAIFPNDRELQTAFIYDCSSGGCRPEDQLYALKLLESFHQPWGEYEYRRRHSRIHYFHYLKTKKKSSLMASLNGINYLLGVTKDAEKRRIMETYKNELETALKKGDYKPG